MIKIYHFRFRLALTRNKLFIVRCQGSLEKNSTYFHWKSYSRKRRNMRSDVELILSTLGKQTIYVDADSCPVKEDIVEIASMIVA